MEIKHCMHSQSEVGSVHLPVTYEEKNQENFAFYKGTLACH